MFQKRWRSIRGRHLKSFITLDENRTGNILSALAKVSSEMQEPIGTLDSAGLSIWIILILKGATIIATVKALRFYIGKNLEETM